ncbi:pentatricopeptide repeat-containing protein At1g08070, chloroplastic-like [Aristolochia californica]|uniref:pentatricopeptide repeat-containing protein At1g08070, chloroplastic-like n=1 Tax=Aristolochia californica TaxID=171875 RepID=UPI0035DABC36
MAYARHFVDRITEPNVFLWNAMLKGYAENEFYRETFIMFSLMKQRGVEVNEFTFPFVLKSCAKLSAITEGKEVHGFVAKSGFQENEFVGTTLIEMYSAGGDMESAYDVFCEMPTRNVVVWTAMVAGYILSGDVQSARRVFDRAPERDVILFDTMVSGHVGVGETASARQLFDQMPTRDIMSWNTMLTAYANSGEFVASERLFEEMPQRNIFTWNGLIGGYARHRRFFEVLTVFKRMLKESEVKPNDTTLVTVLSSCARLGALDLGIWVQVYADSNGFKNNVYINNGLIDMYAKCGSIENAITVFHNMNCRDLITWNAIINGLATHGYGTEALDIFNQMRSSGERPDEITFVGVLCACTHAGLVKDGFTYFWLMSDQYMIAPQIEHYGCMVDLLGKAGLLSEAMAFIKKMPMEPDSVIWSALLGASRIRKNVGLAEFALKQLIQLEPENIGNHVVLSNMYGALGRWEDKARLKLVMRKVGVRKLPGCSLIEVNYAVTEFYSLDMRHHKSQEIYGALIGLTALLKSVGCEPELETAC